MSLRMPLGVDGFLGLYYLIIADADFCIHPSLLDEFFCLCSLI